ncbi:MAG TPA: hypothetical protein VLV30_03660 [Methanomicrobiales archaeon]|nr:hypothetical protein [Methanomicrobiales archaeon]
MPANPVIERLVKGAMERCRERVTAARAGGKPGPGGRQFTDGSSFTRHVKRSHGL